MEVLFYAWLIFSAWQDISKLQLHSWILSIGFGLAFFVSPFCLDIVLWQKILGSIVCIILLDLYTNIQTKIKNTLSPASNYSYQGYLSIWAIVLYCIASLVCIYLNIFDIVLTSIVAIVCLLCVYTQRNRLFVANYWLALFLFITALFAILILSNADTGIAHNENFLFLGYGILFIIIGCEVIYPWVQEYKQCNKHSSEQYQLSGILGGSDSLFVGVLGLYGGIYYAFMSVLLSVLILFCFAIITRLRNKQNINIAIPLIPYFVIGAIISQLLIL